MKYSKDKDKNILVQEENIKDRWREYFDKLFNGQQGSVVWDTIITPLDEKAEFIWRIQKLKVDGTFK